MIVAEIWTFGLKKKNKKINEFLYQVRALTAIRHLWVCWDASVANVIRFKNRKFPLTFISLKSIRAVKVTRWKRREVKKGSSNVDTKIGSWCWQLECESCTKPTEVMVTQRMYVRGVNGQWRWSVQKLQAVEASTFLNLNVIQNYRKV